MSAQSPNFEYEVGPCARALQSCPYRTINLGPDALVLCTPDGSTIHVDADSVRPPVRHRVGWIWTSIRLKTSDGRSHLLQGIRNYEARSLRRTLENWIAPARARYFARAERDIEATQTLLDGLLDESRYLRTSEVERVRVLVQSSSDSIAAELQEEDVPANLVEMHARLGERLLALPEDARAANERFVAASLNRYSWLFDTVESKPLTAAQRRACVINDDHNLVLAGAGTGKTSVMIGRVGYLLAAGLAAPDSILLVAYNRDAAQELRERAAQRLGAMARADQLTIKTFHALGVELIAEAEGIRPSVSPLVQDGHALARFVTGLLNELLRDPAYAAKFIEYGFDRHEPHRSIFDFGSLEEYERELARLDLRTLRGERVKSYEEVRIANFLTRNGVEYKYEEPFLIPTASRQHRQYRPDFTIPRETPGEGRLFLEHFGVDPRGNPPPFFDEASARRYREQMTWKRDLCQQHQLLLIETYSYEFQTGNVFEQLTARLAAHGVHCKARTQTECLDILRDAGIVTGTAEYFATLIPLVREHALDATQVRSRISAMPDYERVRAGLLWDLLQPIVSQYTAHLQQRGEIDFAEMVHRATEYVRSGRSRSPFSHLLVDEFQDISAPRAGLILALARGRPDSTVFCVGDDWQSIYRFAGSDIRYTSEFGRQVGIGTTTALDQTFRFNDQIGRVASDFVMRNPKQVKKDIASLVSVDRPAVSLVATAEPLLALDAVLKRIDGWAERKGTEYSVYVLARYWYQLEPLKRTFTRSHRDRLPHLTWIELSTVHGVKGREADFVVVIGLEEGRNGFPADKPVDSFQEMFLPPREAFPFAEERRLFYVALTRAKHRVYLLYDAVTHSPFIRELKSHGYPVESQELGGGFIQVHMPVVHCPRCETGEIRPKSGSAGTFYGCHRFPACRYRERGCGSCGGLLLRVGDYCVCSNPRCDGVHLACGKCGAPMERRSGPHGVFFGCSNFGRVDLIEQCAATQRWRQLPTAAQLRDQARSASGVQA